MLFGLLDLRLVQKGEENEVLSFENLSHFIFIFFGSSSPHTHQNSPVELTQDNIECILELSVRFSVGMLIEQCCNFLASAVAVDTACAILILADVSMLFYLPSLRLCLLEAVRRYLMTAYVLIPSLTYPGLIIAEATHSYLFLVFTLHHDLQSTLFSHRNTTVTLSAAILCSML